MKNGLQTPDVARLQEQLQAERDLRASLEVGLSMSSGKFSGSRSMDSKTRAELEEIALAEADVARLKQKVAELHHQLNQQCQHHYGTLSDTSDRYQRATNTSAQQLSIQRLEIANNDLRQRIAKEARGNAILQSSLERRKQAFMNVAWLLNKMWQDCKNSCKQRYIYELLWKLQRVEFFLTTCINTIDNIGRCTLCLENLLFWC